MKTLSKLLIGIVIPLLMLAVIFMSVEALAGDRAWLKKEYEKLDINWYTGMSTEDQVRAFMQMVDYMKAKTDTMEVTVTVDGEQTLMYNEREISHMRDVRRLYQLLTGVKWMILCLALTAAVLAFEAYKKTKEERREILRFAAKTAVISFICIFLFVLALGVWALIDFDSFWAAFHIVFLDLESSTFDPAVSRMIRICPAELFEDMVIRMFTLAGAVLALFAAVSAVYLGVSKKRMLSENDQNKGYQA